MCATKTNASVSAPTSIPNATVPSPTSRLWRTPCWGCLSPGLPLIKTLRTLVSWKCLQLLFSIELMKVIYNLLCNIALKMKLYRIFWFYLLFFQGRSPDMSSHLHSVICFINLHTCRAHTVKVISLSRNVLVA